MKQTWILIVFCILMNGCKTISETEAPHVSSAEKIGIAVRLEGFQLESLQKTGVNVGSTNATAYNWKTNSTVTAYGSTTSAQYEYRPDNVFSNIVTDAFENTGINIRSNNPKLVLVGRIGKGRFPWTSAAFWYRDAPVFLLAIPTFASVLSCTRENDVTIIVYDCSGNRLKKYSSTQTYNSFSIGFPFANFANDKAYEWYGDRKSAEFAFLDCLKSFLHDVKNGYFAKQLAK